VAVGEMVNPVPLGELPIKFPPKAESHHRITLPDEIPVNTELME